MPLAGWLKPSSSPACHAMADDAIFTRALRATAEVNDGAQEQREGELQAGELAS